MQLHRNTLIARCHLAQGNKACLHAANLMVHPHNKNSYIAWEKVGNRKSDVIKVPPILLCMKPLSLID